jgi:uncharacterized protein (DUF4213/DUF364 family)
MLKKLKNIFKIISIPYILFLLKINIFAESFENDIIPKVDSIAGKTEGNTQDGTSIINSILNFVQESIFSLLAVIAI